MADERNNDTAVDEEELVDTDMAGDEESGGKTTVSEVKRQKKKEAEQSAREEEETSKPAPKPAPRSMSEEAAKPRKDSQKKKQPGKVKRWFKNFFSELKKVTWPSFPKVLKQTGIVLLVTVCFLLVLMAFDALFGLLYNYLVSGLTKESIAAFAATARLVGGGGIL